jgi:hypothetical protein
MAQERRWIADVLSEARGYILVSVVKDEAGEKGLVGGTYAAVSVNDAVTDISPSVSSTHHITRNGDIGDHVITNAGTETGVAVIGVSGFHFDRHLVATGNLQPRMQKSNSQSTLSLMKAVLRISSPSTGAWQNHNEYLVTFR